jgi:hypothetical protein
VEYVADVSPTVAPDPAGRVRELHDRLTVGLAATRLALDRDDLDALGGAIGATCGGDHQSDHSVAAL